MLEISHEVALDYSIILQEKIDWLTDRMLQAAIDDDTSMLKKYHDTLKHLAGELTIMKRIAHLGEGQPGDAHASA